MSATNVSGVIGHAAITPVLATASVRAEQVTQLVLGETASISERAGEWLRITTALDGYDGWVHEGYVRVVPADEAGAWRRRASLWWEGGSLSVDGAETPLPLRARLAPAGDAAELPDGRRGRPAPGVARAGSAVAADAGRMPAETWALEHFRGAPYQWGGLTPWGVDCSGLVQTTYLARGLVLPRDASQQAGAGEPVALDALHPGDLLFFRGETTSAITHVAFLAEGDALVHSTIALGGVVHEPFTAGSRAGDLLRPRLAGARRVATREGAR